MKLVGEGVMTRLEFEDERERKRFAGAARSCCSSIVFAGADGFGMLEATRASFAIGVFLFALAGSPFSSEDVSYAIDMMGQEEMHIEKLLGTRNRLRCPEALERQLALVRWAKCALEEAERGRVQNG